MIRLGGLRWGPEVDDTGQAAEAAMEQRDAELCLGFADTLEVRFLALYFHALRRTAQG